MWYNWCWIYYRNSLFYLLWFILLCWFSLFWCFIKRFIYNIVNHFVNQSRILSCGHSGLRPLNYRSLYPMWYNLCLIYYRNYIILFLVWSRDSSTILLTISWTNRGYYHAAIRGFAPCILCDTIYVWSTIGITLFYFLFVIHFICCGIFYCVDSLRFGVWSRD